MTFDGLSWDDGRIYTINSRGLDYAGNLSEWTTESFRYDDTIPEISLLKPNTGYHTAYPVFPAQHLILPAIQLINQRLEG